MLVSGLNVFSGFRSCLSETFIRSCRQSIRSQSMQPSRSSSHEEGPSLLTMRLSWKKAWSDFLARHLQKHGDADTKTSSVSDRFASEPAPP